MHELSPAQIRLQQVAGVCMLAGAALFMLYPIIATVTYTIGALFYSPLRMLQRYEGHNFIILRLRRQQLLAQLAFLCAACCMAMQAANFGFARRGEWVVCLTVACVIELYTTLRISAELRKIKD